MIKAEVRHWSDPNELASALRKMLAPNKLSFESKLESIAAILAAFLKEKECPHPTEFCLFSGAYWCDLPIGWDQMSDAEMRLAMKNATVGLGAAYIKQNFKLTDPEAIAADICLRIFGYPRLSAEQKPEAAFHIGRLSQLLSSLRHLKMVERGKDDKKTKSSAAKSTLKKVREERRIEQSVTLMRRFVEEKGFSVKRAAELTARKIGVTPSAMRSRWYAAMNENNPQKPV